MEKRKERLVQFAEHLKGELSHKAFIQLHHTLGIKLYRLNRLLKGLEDWYLDEIGKIAPLLDADPIDLIQKWGLGRKYISLEDLDQLLAERGLEVHFAVHAA